MSGSVEVSVIIPTLNGGEYLDDVLSAIESQDFPEQVEILVIDSGSTDGTLDIVAKHPASRLLQIAKEDFGHGRTRNLGAREARGRFVAFLTQDAIPAHNQWLSRLIEPLKFSTEIWAVYGMQIPRNGCPPMQKYEIRGVFAGSGSEFGVTLVGARWNDAPYPPIALFYSDVNSASRRETLVEVLPYRDVIYGEDQLFGQDVVSRGAMKAYAPTAAVIHSNDIPLKDYAHRIFDEAMALKSSGSAVAVGPWPVRMARVARGVVGDSLRIARDPDYGFTRKIYWWAVNPRFHAAKWRGYRWAELTAVADVRRRAKFSLESRRSTASR